MILLLALAAASLASLILARQIVQPLRRIARGTKALVSGRYDLTLPVGGDELGDLAQDFNLLARTLQRNEDARRHWIADISHELRTPLAVLRGEIEALQDGLRPLAPAGIASLHTEVLSLSKLVDDLFELSLSDLGALNYRRDRMDLAMTVVDAVESFRTRFEGKDIRLNSDIAGEVTIYGDRRRLGQLFGNLLENSYRHTDEGGRCEIRLETSANAVVATIEDSAPGVPPSDLDKLFERLFRVDSSRSREHGGAGLGLAICKNIVEAHNGAISASASNLGGLRLRIEFPRPIA
jgi:two-component system sensor histidine kinase BaeS